MAQTEIGALCARLEALEGQWRAGMALAMEAAAQAALERARECVPVDTGNLRRSLTARAEGLTAGLSAGADYAAYVELGTGGARGRTPRPYMRPAFAAGRAQAVRLAMEVMV
ncbi:MAG TPA: HK97 gp10 family phage protein [Candidatus Pullichristensenella avicola]|nr:HK97 gp10 family phage protein [Candidatus Pullichristensenella avicola]